MATTRGSRGPPSRRWPSFDGWDFNGMKQRLEASLAAIDKSVLVEHVQRIKGQKVTMSEPFSAGEHWICFEMIAEDGDLIIARVRLPRHPKESPSFGEKEDAYQISCELAAMKLVQKRLPAIPIPTVYAYEGYKSQLAADAGAVYMLIEGFYGNTLQSVVKEVAEDMCTLPSPLQEHIITQWTRVQVELATLTFDKIGAIASVSDAGEATIGNPPGVDPGVVPGTESYPTAWDYFVALVDCAEGLIANAPSLADVDSDGDSMPTMALGLRVFRDIMNHTSLFDDGGVDGCYPLNHMDLEAKNILVDEHFNFVAIIDWEFAKAAPWQVNSYPKPFCLLGLSDEAILQDPKHPAYTEVLQEVALRKMYNDKFRDAERQLESKGARLGVSFADALNSPASRIYACFSALDFEGGDEDNLDLVRTMVMLAFELDERGTDKYIREMRHAPLATGIGVSHTGLRVA